MRYFACDAGALEVPRESAYEVLRRVADGRGDAPAIDYLGAKISYRELVARIDHAANAFAAIGVGEDDVVSLATANIPENAVALYALNKIGAIANMVDLTLIGGDLRGKIADAGSRVVVGTDLFLDGLLKAIEGSGVEHVIVTSPGDSLPALKRFAFKLKTGRAPLSGKCVKWRDFERRGSAAPCAPAAPYAPDRVACVLYTSGTTGKPKGAMLTNENLNGMAVEYANCGMVFSPGDRMFNENPPFISYCIVLGINLPLALGMCIVMMPSYEPDHFARRVFESKAQHILACPADWSNFKADASARTRDYSFLSTLASGGVAFNPAAKGEMNGLLAQLGCKNPIVEGYGMTEGSSAMCTNTPAYNVLGTVGIPLPLMNACIWDSEAGRELGYGEVGEICFSGPTVMKGYLGAPEATAGALRAHPDGRTWLHTGDLGLIRDDGGIEVVGRIKRLIVRYDGFKISPFEIERHICECDGVADCCVVSAPDAEHGFGSVPAAFIVPEPGRDAQAVVDAARTACARTLPTRNLPVRYEALDALPLTKVGKVDYRELERRAAE